MTDAKPEAPEATEHQPSRTRSPTRSTPWSSPATRCGPGRGELAYTARTGRVVLREEEVENDVFQGWKARAEMSVTAYTLDDADLTTRPITFVFNGGPGSSSIWLHMGLLGPAPRGPR